MYPTAPKLIAATLYAALAWGVSTLVVPHLPTGTPTWWFAPANAAIGALIGWRLMGRLIGRGYVSALGMGFTTGIVVVFWALLLWSGREMLDRAVNLRYRGPVEALEAMIDLALRYLSFLWTPDVLLAMGVGAAVCGCIVEWASRRAG